LGGSFGQDLNSIEAGWQVREKEKPTSWKVLLNAALQFPFLFFIFFHGLNNFSSARVNNFSLVCCNNDMRTADERAIKWVGARIDSASTQMFSFMSCTRLLAICGV
jgi:hypothetical protein